MPEPKEKNKTKRIYKADMLALESLRLIAAPNPKDDLSDDQLTEYCHHHSQSSELIQHLIEYVKNI